VLTHATWIVPAKLRCKAGEHPLRRLLTSNGRRRARAGLVHAPVGRTSRIALEAGGASRFSENGQHESSYQASRLLIAAKSDEKVLQLRRAEDREGASYEILAPMASSSPTTAASSETSTSGASSAASSGVSAFIARVLDQLTLSAWLPAAFLTASVAVLLQFRSARSANMLNAVRELTANPVQVLVIIIPLLVVATVVTQAFSFEAIRALEGYWPGRGLVSAARTLMIWRHVHRKKMITERRLKQSAKALRAAMPEMLISGVSLPIVKALEAYLSGKEPPQLTSEEREVVASTEWRLWCNASRLAKIDYLLNEENSYPDAFRILPTKLGNLLRATEDRLAHTEGDLQGYALRRYEMVSPQLQIQHDVFRNRLEMYCTLVFVSASLMFFALVALLGHVSTIAVAITSTSFAVMSVVSYLAALASAGGYCFVLRQMDQVSPASDEE
jgi:hypothetical protein